MMNMPPGSKKNSVKESKDQNIMDTQPDKSNRNVPLWVQILIWLSLLGLLALVALALGKAQTPILKKGSIVPEFKLSFYEGFEYDGLREIALSDLNGKVVVLNFWASWCKPCESEAADLEEAWRYYQPEGKVIFIGVDYVDTEPEARSYLAKFEVSYPNAPDIGTNISQIFNRNLGVPETYIIDQEGVLKYIKIGPFTSIGEIQMVIDSILAGE